MCTYHGAPTLSAEYMLVACKGRVRCALIMVHQRCQLSACSWHVRDVCDESAQKTESCSISFSTTNMEFFMHINICIHCMRMLNSGCLSIRSPACICICIFYVVLKDYDINVCE